MLLQGIDLLSNSQYVRVGIHKLRCRDGSLYSMSVFVTHIHNQKLRRVLSCYRVLCSTVGEQHTGGEQHTEETANMGLHDW